MDVSDLKRIKELEVDNSKLSRMYADLAIEDAATKDLIDKKTVGPAAKLEAARYMTEEHELSVTRSCQCVRLSRTAYYRVPEDWTVRDAPLIGEMAALVAGRPNRGFWTFNVVDDFNREAMHIEVNTSITSESLISVFQLLRVRHGLPQVLLTDNGPMTRWMT